MIFEVDVKRARDTCATLAQEQHRPTCLIQLARNEWAHPHPDCSGCATDVERAMWDRIASEIEQYLTGQGDILL